MEEPTEGAIQGEIVSILITGRHGVTKELEELRGKTEIILTQFLGRKITLIRPCISLSMKEKSAFYEKLSGSSVLINRPKIDCRGGILPFKNMKQQLTLTLFSLSLIAFLAPPSAKADIFDALVYCRVTGIRTGQLALRHQPNGAAHAGLDNGNLVQAFGGSITDDGKVWYEVTVLEGPNSQVEGKEGVVNADYLACEWYDFDGNLIRRD